jgi:UDP-glucuronate decarboxylase
MKKILVTGGAGFLGSHLCDRLINQGHHVLCVDNYFTGSKKNIYHLLDSKNFEVIRQDISIPLYVEVDEIYNLACPASPHYYQLDPIQTLKTSVIGSFNMLGLAKRTGAKILQASTSECYGDPTIHPQPETYWGNVNPIGIRSCYDEGKRAAETLFMDYNREHLVNTRIMRIFNTYGPRMNINDGRVVSNFIVQAIKGQDITVYGNGSQTRSFCYFEDNLDAMMALMNHPSYKWPVNVGNPIEFTMLELAETVIKMTESKSKIVFRDLPEDDPKQRKPDIGRAKELLNWEPKVGLDEGLRKTIEYFRGVI